MAPWCHPASPADLRVSRPPPRGTVSGMFAVTRLRPPEHEGSELAMAVGELLAALAARPGFVDGEVGRSTEDGGLWALFTRWDGVGSYRRALSAADVKIARAPVWGHALDEPGVYGAAGDGPGGARWGRRRGGRTTPSGRGRSGCPRYRPDRKRSPTSRPTSCRRRSPAGRPAGSGRGSRCTRGSCRGVAAGRR